MALVPRVICRVDVNRLLFLTDWHSPMMSGRACGLGHPCMRRAVGAGDLSAGLFRGSLLGESGARA